MSGEKQKWTALITGASGGIGKDLAGLFAADGHDVILVARDELKLQDLAGALAREHGVRATVLTADLGRPDAPEALARRIADAGLTVDVLVNNAGYASFGPFAEADTAGQLGMIQLNITALTHLTRLFLPGMVARGRGRVLNVASTAAFQPGPLMAVYYATKAYVLSLSEALANEVAGSGVAVTALCPGPTSTGFQARAQMEESKLVRGKKIMDSLTVARAGYDGMLRGKSVVIPGVKNKLLAQSVRFTPRSMVTRLVRSFQDRAEH